MPHGPDDTISPDADAGADADAGLPDREAAYRLAVTFHCVAGIVLFQFTPAGSDAGGPVAAEFRVEPNATATGRLMPLIVTHPGLAVSGRKFAPINTHPSSARAFIARVFRMFPTQGDQISIWLVPTVDVGRCRAGARARVEITAFFRLRDWLIGELNSLAYMVVQALDRFPSGGSPCREAVFEEYARTRYGNPTGPVTTSGAARPPTPPAPLPPAPSRPDRETRRRDAEAWEAQQAAYRREFEEADRARMQREAAIRERARQVLAKQEAADRERRERRQAAATQAKRSSSPTASAPAPNRPPPPEVPVHFEIPRLQFQDSLVPLTDLRGWNLRETAAQWWISNQSDDLLALPYCRIERLDYQVRAALRVIGPMRGRALLSDEVGLGKTVEAGLVLKEYLVRGMVKRFLVLTQPSLVDQWAEELAAKFGIEVATTNGAAFRSDPAAFWRGQTAIVASLHMLKQPAHLEVAGKVSWDLLVIDEAHHLRNRTSQSWQAVNALPRQFLLLLTATPVQNSLEELYNLVTLLQPGQLAPPKEFRARFLDPKRPHQPKEPEELRRLLGQVMIRNTRANAGLNLPPRRAETVMFEPDPAERGFWQGWESELRRCLTALPASQSSLWGRLLLQAAGSSPSAWRSALEKFPDAPAARTWQASSLAGTSWAQKCALVAPLARHEGGVVVFTQFLATQAALVEDLRKRGVAVIALNGSTPAADRQPLTDRFRQQGGVLVLTQSGTEGRNLQFCHQLVNFDLPWNPMEIEQRIGRLHRLGQQHPVRISNFVQAGTLQEHLLNLLQDKLNLFELVVGETGLILGERYAGEEFAEEVLRRWREGEGRVAESLADLGQELAEARDAYGAVKELDATLFAQDYANL